MRVREVSRHEATGHVREPGQPDAVFPGVGDVLGGVELDQPSDCSYNPTIPQAGGAEVFVNWQKIEN